MFPVFLNVICVSAPRLGAVTGVVTVKLLPDVTEPPGVVSEIGPVVAAAGTANTADVFVFELIPAVLLLKNFALVIPARFVPETVTKVPTGPLVGEKLVIVGAAA